MQFHLYFEKLIMKGSQHIQKDGAVCTRAEKDLSHGFIFVQGSLDPNHLIFEINVEKSRFRHTTTLKLNHAIFNRF